MIKDYIDSLVNLPKLIRRIYFLLWAILGFFFILKLCFGLWYPIVVENEVIMYISNFIDEHVYIKNFIQACFYCFNLNVIYLICSGKQKMTSKKEIIIINIMTYLSFVLKSCEFRIYMIFEYSVMVFIPLIIRDVSKYEKFRFKIFGKSLALLNLLIILLWQLTILFVRGLDLNQMNYLPFIIGLVLQIDYYIFLGIMYMQRRLNTMGLWGGLLFGKTIEECKELLRLEKLSDKPNLDKVEEIEKQIKKLEIDEEIKRLKNEKDTI